MCILKGYFTRKWKFFHHLLTLISLQTCIHLFRLKNTKQIIANKTEFQTTLETIDLYCGWRNTETSFKIFYLCSTKERMSYKYRMTKVSKWWLISYIIKTSISPFSKILWYAVCIQWVVCSFSVYLNWRKKICRNNFHLSVLCRVCRVPASCVHIWFVSCPRLMWLLVNSCPAVFV